MNSMEQSPSWENNNSSATQIPHVLWNPKVQYCIHNSCHLSPLWARSIQSMPPPHPTSRQQKWFLCSVDCASIYNLVNETNLVHYLFLVYFVNFIYNLYLFWTSLGPSSGRTTVFMWRLVLVIMYSWLSGMQDGFIPSCIPDNHLYRITSTKYRTNTVVPPGLKHVEVINKIDKKHYE